MNIYNTHLRYIFELWTTSYDERPIISSQRTCFYNIVCNELPLNFAYANLQKYFFNIQWHE